MNIIIIKDGFLFLPLKISLTIYYIKPNTKIEKRNLIFSKNKLETSTHLILKFLSYLYYFDQNMIIEPSFRFRGFRADLLSWKDSEIPQNGQKEPDIWIECKKVKMKKLLKLARALPTSQIVWFHNFLVLNRIIGFTQDRTKKGFPLNVRIIGVKYSSKISDNIFHKQQSWFVERDNLNTLKLKYLDNQDREYLVTYIVLKK